jgi:hypothetical protein
VFGQLGGQITLISCETLKLTSQQSSAYKYSTNKLVNSFIFILCKGKLKTRKVKNLFFFPTKRVVVALTILGNKKDSENEKCDIEDEGKAKKGKKTKLVVTILKWGKQKIINYGEKI